MTSDEACLIRGDSGEAIQHVLALVGDKWSVLIMATLLNQPPQRFSELRQSVPRISQRMLTLNLRRLEHGGLLTRTSHPEVPPRVEYQLTEMGQSLAQPILSLARWARHHDHHLKHQHPTPGSK
ncbi:MAG: helix-turn-helix transcriptional regulator [Actinobacteria bacterium]|nr:helix-turn-helix transcriptional regulator [Actinomycetota bacterium]